MLSIRFDPNDVPADAFITADEAWRRCRANPDQALRFGHGDAHGLWFVRVNVVRDHYTLHGLETSAWDGWRRAIGQHEELTQQEIAATDELAAQTEESRRIAPPPWESVRAGA